MKRYWTRAIPVALALVGALVSREGRAAVTTCRDLSCSSTSPDPAATWSDGYWLNPSSGAVHFKSGQVACWVTFTQWLALGRPAARSLGELAPQFEAKYQPIECHNSELGLWLNGYYQTADGAVWLLNGAQACWVTWEQWVAAGQPVGELTWLGADSDRFRGSMATGQFCTTADFARPIVTADHCCGSNDGHLHSNCQQTVGRNRKEDREACQKGGGQLVPSTEQCEDLSSVHPGGNFSTFDCSNRKYPSKK